MAIDKEAKKLALKILEVNGKDHDTWLNEKYKEIIFSNVNILQEGIDLKMEMNK